ncbi:MAG: tungsten formylmethanofuran dehydrogenase [Methylovirgula sp.]|uniref:tungsten formylmethanofuran dehydrogenase n=1 Tax=Methylovirgula sp. TaxID=1978224 RepID=UPI0030765DA2
MTAYVDGAAVPLETAIAEAARLLDAARLPLVAGLQTDVAGARAAILLAEKLRGAYDHAASDALLRDVGVLRQAGRMVTTANDVRLRAETILLVGPRLTALWPELAERLALKEPPRLGAEKASRKIFWLGGEPGTAASVGATEIAVPAGQLPQAVAALRAAVAGRKTRTGGALAKSLTELAETLKAAHFGAAVWSAESLDELTIEALSGLVLDLNQKTRFTNLAFGPAQNAAGVLQTSGWMTGFPIRTGFGRGYPEHDVWRFDANRLVDTGEADAAVWISAYGATIPGWRRKVPFVALTKAGTTFPYPPKVQIEVGTPGQDHDAIEWAREITTFATTPAKVAGDAPRVADVIGQISEHLKGNEAC